MLSARDIAARETADNGSAYKIKPATVQRKSPSQPVVNRALQLIVEHEQEIRDAWHQHFDS